MAKVLLLPWCPNCLHSPLLVTRVLVFQPWLDKYENLNHSQEFQLNTYQGPITAHYGYFLCNFEHPTLTY